VHGVAAWQVAAGLQQSALVTHPASIVLVQPAINLAAGIRFSRHVPTFGNPRLTAIQLVPLTHVCPVQSCPHRQSGNVAWDKTGDRKARAMKLIKDKRK
jgi:hypothetical protein